MVLLVTNSLDKTADYISEKASFPIFRFNTDLYIKEYEIVQNESEWQFQNIKNRATINDKNIAGIIYRRPVNPNIEIDSESLKQELIREGRCIYESILENINTKWISFPRNVRFAENRIKQLTVAKELGFKIPKYILPESV